MKISRVLILFLILSYFEKHLDAQDNTCGVPKQEFALIFGGDTAKKGDFPWFAALFMPDDSGKKSFFCGGVLVTTEKVLTAAHCILFKRNESPVLPRDVTVFLGGYDLDKPFEPGTLSVSPKSITVHPEWNPFSTRFDADIAMIFLDSPISFSNNINPICILSPGQGLDIYEGFLVGYGKSEDPKKEHETIPRVVKLPIKSNEECFLDNFLLAKLSSNRTFCAGTKIGLGACRGDSGSGFFIKIGSIYYLRGIVSSSLFKPDGQCDVFNYAVYTDITKFLDWIENTNDSSTVIKTHETTSTTTESQITPQIIPQTTPQITPPTIPQIVSSPTPKYSQSCGIMSQPVNLIQGGQKSSRKSFPWTVAIFVREDVDVYEHKAVGTLISNKHVVSLGNPLSYLNNANILLPIDVKRLKMYFGVESFSEAYVDSSLIIDGALKIILHPNIRLQIPRSADVAVTFLLSPIFTTEFISPACLMQSNRLAILGKVGYAVGWGINEAGVVSEFKKQTALTVSNQDYCYRSYSSYFTYGDKYFCALSQDKISTACELDDPFYMKIDGKWFLTGLINAFFFNSDENKCSSLSPVLYEEISSYTNWIQSAIK